MKHCKQVQFLLLVKAIFGKKTRKPEQQKPQPVEEDFKFEIEHKEEQFELKIEEVQQKPIVKKVCKRCKLETIEEECETPSIFRSMVGSGVSQELNVTCHEHEWTEEALSDSAFEHMTTTATLE